MADYSYIGSGKIYLRDRSSATAGLIEVGNASVLNFAITEDVVELKDYTQAGGGTFNEVRRINAVEVSMTLHELNAANLARALYGSASAVTAGTVTDEPHNDVVAGSLIPTDFMPSAITTVKKGAATLVAGTDYEVRGAGILAKAGGAIVTGDDITITYTKAATDVVEMLTNSGKEFEMMFDGLNEARSGKKTRVNAFRVRVGAAQNLGLIGEEYAALELTGKLLKDTSITGAGLSQYAKIEVQQ